MTPAANMAFLSRFKEEVEKAKAELTTTGQDDPYFRAKAFYRACEFMPPLPLRITRIRPTSTPPSPTTPKPILARGEQYDPAFHATPARKAFQ